MGGGHGLSLVPAGHMDRSMCHPILAPRAPYMFDVFLPLHLGAQRCSVCILVLDLGPWRARGSQAQGYPYFRKCTRLWWPDLGSSLHPIYLDLHVHFSFLYSLPSPTWSLPLPTSSRTTSTSP